MNCPKCRALIPADDVNLATLYAKCGRCHEVFRFDDAPKSRDKLRMPRPASLVVEETDAGNRIVRRWFTPIILFLLVFVIVWNSALMFWYTRAFGMPDASWLAILFPLFHVMIGIHISYAVLAGLLNRTIVEVRNGMLQIEHAPIPWPGNSQLKASDILQLYCDETRVGRHGHATVYNLHAILVHEGQRKLLSSLKKNEALYYEQQLEEWLDIQPRPVVGAVN
jgi:hypothetical protein